MTDLDTITHSLLLFQLMGEAEAFAIEAEARAEAEQMEKKAAAWSDYKDAAMIEMVLKMLPRVSFSLSILFIDS